MPKYLRNILNVKQVAALSTPGFYHDGGGLYLQVNGAMAKSWVMRLRVNGKTREMGLGSAHDVTLAQARILAEKARHLAHSGVDPIAKRKQERAATTPVKVSTVPTFAECYREWRHALGDKSAKYRSNVDSDMRRRVEPVIGDLPVSQVTVHHIVQIFKPIWKEHHAIATRTLSVVRRVLKYAKQLEYRFGDNPAAMENLDAILTKVEKSGVHYARADYSAVPRFMFSLRGLPGGAARLAEFIILTGVRTKAARRATWDQIDFGLRRWRMPKEMTKRLPSEFHVPLNDRAVAILREMADRRQNDWVFPGSQGGLPFGESAALAVVRALAAPDWLALGLITTHGFRSTFGDWARNQGYSKEWVDLCLGHKNLSATDEAYYREVAFAPRVPIIKAWGDYCMSWRVTE